MPMTAAQMRARLHRFGVTSAAGGAIIATPVVIGDNGLTGGSGSTTSSQLVTLAGGVTVAAGDLIVIAAGSSSSNVTIDGCSDPKNGSYSLGGAGADGSFSTVRHFFVYATVPLVAGDVITTTFSGNGTSSKYVQAFKVPGGLLGPTASVMDKASTATNTTNSTATVQPNITTPALSQASEIAFVTMLFSPYSATLTSAGSFANFASPPFTNFDVKVVTAWEIVSSASAIAYTGTLNDTSGGWVPAFTTFRGA